MLGWHISIFLQRDGGATPATADSQLDSRLAVWQSDWNGLGWIDDLRAAGKAIDLGGNGYPCRYTVQARYLIPEIMEGPPCARKDWVSGAGDILTEKWAGKTLIDDKQLSACHPDEWLLVEAWDES